MPVNRICLKLEQRGNWHNKNRLFMTFNTYKYDYNAFKYSVLEICLKYHFIIFLRLYPKSDGDVSVI